jgi:hypothetical protein
MQHPNIETLHYNCESLFFHLGISGMCTIGKSVRINLVFQFHRYSLPETEIYTHNASRTNFLKMLKWINQKEDPLQIPSEIAVVVV